MYLKMLEKGKRNAQKEYFHTRDRSVILHKKLKNQVGKYLKIIDNKNN